MLQVLGIKRSKVKVTLGPACWKVHLLALLARCAKTSGRNVTELLFLVYLMSNMNWFFRSSDQSQRHRKVRLDVKKFGTRYLLNSLKHRSHIWSQGRDWVRVKVNCCRGWRHSRGPFGIKVWSSYLRRRSRISLGGDGNVLYPVLSSFFIDSLIH